MSDLVLVTGIGGFIARHVARALLADGYRVRGTVREAARGPTIRESLVAAGVEVGGLTFAVADLERDEGWQDAVAGCRYVQHVASPFPLANPRNREALVPTARGGALRVLEAALGAGVERIVMTSSVVTMMYRPGRPRELRLREGDWTDATWPALTAYMVAKTRAELAATERARAAGAGERLVSVNPGLVLGPSIGGSVGASLGLIEMMLRGAYPAVPPIAFPIADARDVARLQVAAMVAPGAGGRRLMAGEATLSLAEIGQVLRTELGAHARRVPTRELPAALVRMLALVDPKVRAAVAGLDCRCHVETGYVTELTGVRFRPAREAVTAATRSLIETGRV
ncbi:MAG: NAD-dependent epimerase/dehydratase family protein [Rhizobiales bacterium]|nr:NAD-dependent epimerase/dehydratase family protein [Hyphomicrobiales bacterium]